MRKKQQRNTMKLNSEDKYRFEEDERALSQQGFKKNLRENNSQASQSSPL